MQQATSLIGIAQENALRIYLFDFGRYFIAAALIAALVWILRRTRLASRKIQAREASWSDFRREFAASAQTVVVYVLVSIAIIWGFRHGYYHEFGGQVTPLVFAGYLAAILLIHDTYFYWAHRAMHARLLYKHFHRFHHRTVTPTPWTAYSFALPEAIVMALFMPAWLWFVPTPGPVLFTFLAVMILRNAMGHAGLELHPRGWASHPVLKWVSTTTHHDLHHAGSFNHNFGFYFTWWDKLMGTEHPRYVEIFDEVTMRSAAPAAKVRPAPRQQTLADLPSAARTLI